jgi:hypothetical protein
MGKRGPKPVDIGMLNMWEFEWYKAFHLLRDGLQLPYPNSVESLGAPPPYISRSQVQDWLRRLKGMDDAEWLRINEETCAEISRRDGSEKYQPTPKATNRDMSLWWANGQRKQEIAELETYLNPKKIPEAMERKQLWENLWRARTIPVLKEICDKWAKLREVRFGFPAPDYILANAGEFLRMKRDKRFPKSDSPAFDEARVDYLARGMAGIFAHVSPMTGIERLRNMEHGPDGPLWRGDRLPDDTFTKGNECCQCWRCELERSRPAYKFSAEAWWNGMAAFMQTAIRESKRGVKP